MTGVTNDQSGIYINKKLEAALGARNLYCRDERRGINRDPSANHQEGPKLDKVTYQLRKYSELKIILKHHYYNEVPRKIKARSRRL